MMPFVARHFLSSMTHSNDELPRDGGPREAAHYIAETLADLADMARRHDLGMLGYLLDMAQLEADELVRARG